MLCADSCACWLVGVAQATATGAINWAIQLAAGPALAAGSDFRMPRNAQREMRNAKCAQICAAFAQLLALQITYLCHLKPSAL